MTEITHADSEPSKPKKRFNFDRVRTIGLLFLIMINVLWTSKNEHNKKKAAADELAALNRLPDTSLYEPKIAAYLGTGSEDLNLRAVAKLEKIGNTEAIQDFDKAAVGYDKMKLFAEDYTAVTVFSIEAATRLAAAKPELMSPAKTFFLHLAQSYDPSNSHNPHVYKIATAVTVGALKLCDTQAVDILADSSATGIKNYGAGEFDNSGDSGEGNVALATLLHGLTTTAQACRASYVSAASSVNLNHGPG